MNRCILLVILMTPWVCFGSSVSVIDDLGNRVELPRPAESVISLAPHLTEMLFSLGAGDQILATVRHSDYPPAAKELPQLGDAFSLSLEAVVSLSPDLILAWSTGGNQQTVARLRDLGFTVYINEARSLEAIASNLERIGALMGKADEGSALAGSFRHGLASLRDQTHSRNQRVFFQIADAQLYTVNHQHLIGEAMSVCGATNIFGDLPMPVPLVSFESVVAADPEIILVASPHPDFVSRWQSEWQKLGWAARVRYVEASLITRPGLRMLEGIKTLCKRL